MITMELVLEPEPQVPRGAATFLNDLLKIRGDHVGELAEDDDIDPSLAGVVGEGIIRLDVVGESISRQCQNDVHEGRNVWHCNHLDVEVGDDGVFV
jgi:hypothetical protein